MATTAGTAYYKTDFMFPSGESYTVVGLPSSKHITKNFTFYEATNKLAADSVKLVVSWRFLKFATMLQELRTYYGKPFNVNSWYRTAAFNKKCGGDAKSLHLDGLAADIQFPKLQAAVWVKLRDKWAEICKAHGEIGGINRYTNGIHFSIGEEKFGNTSFTIRDYRGVRGDW